MLLASQISVDLRDRVYVRMYVRMYVCIYICWWYSEKVSTLLAAFSKLFKHRRHERPLLLESYKGAQSEGSYCFQFRSSCLIHCYNGTVYVLLVYVDLLSRN